MANKWNWQKIEKTTVGTKNLADLNLPDFKVPVLLADKREDGKIYVMVGWLKHIDETGAHWSANDNNLFAGIFGDIFNVPTTNKKEDNTFTPTHWCKIEKPE
jgi:hypothetical protein